MKIMIFGTGKFYQNRKNQIASDCVITAFIDNNQVLQGKQMDCVPIISPSSINQFTYDKIVLMSAKKYADEMRNQLIELGVASENILSWEQLCSERLRGSFRFYCGNSSIIQKRKKILILSTILDYNGGTLAAVYAARALQERGYNVILAAAEGNQEFIHETVEGGINVVLCPALPYLHEEEIFWIQQFDAVLVNVFQMIKCACDICNIKPVLWWIHEPSTIYEPIMNQFIECACQEEFSKANVYAVSGIPQKIFNHYFPGVIKETLGYGIPDENREGIIERGSKNKTVFAIIGNVCPRKAQDIFVRSAKLLEGKDRADAEFWIIGFIGEDEYSNQIKELALNEPSIKIMGLLTRKELRKIYPEIDAVVCPSLEDPLPVVMTECMMYGKACVVSDATGTIDYIKDGENGFICKKGDISGLSEKMGWIIHNKEKLQEIGLNARQTYEAYFSLEKFGERLEAALLNTIEKYGS